MTKILGDTKLTEEISSSYSLPTATASTLGGVKVGDGLTVASDGTLSADSNNGSGLQLADSDNTSGTAYQLQQADGTAVTTITIGTRADGSTVGSFSCAEGTETTASGYYSHSEGMNTIASGSSTHAEGYLSNASGNFSHAENYATTASGYCSHSEGYDTTASAYYSHAEGLSTTASSEAQHVFGKYNTPDTSSAYVEIVGNGTDSSTTSNARTLDWSGNEVLAGTLTLGGSSGETVKAVSTGLRTTDCFYEPMCQYVCSSAKTLTSSLSKVTCGTCYYNTDSSMFQASSGGVKVLKNCNVLVSVFVKVNSATDSDSLHVATYRDSTKVADRYTRLSGTNAGFGYSYAQWMNAGNVLYLYAQNGTESDGSITTGLNGASITLTAIG